MSVKVELFSGFLGAGKTQLIKKLIEEEKIKAIKSSKNYLISEFEYLKLIEAMEVKQDEK